MLKSKRSSRYGSICNNGQIGFLKKMTPNLIDAITSITNIDDIIIQDNSGELLVTYCEHDGTHNCTIYPITKSKADRIENMLLYSNFDIILDYISKMTSVKTK